MPFDSRPPRPLPVEHPRPFQGDFGPFATAEALLAGRRVVVAVERFAPRPEGVTVANPALRIARHLDAPLRYRRPGPTPGRLVEEFIAPGQHFVFGAGAEARFAWDEGFRTLSLTVAPDLVAPLDLSLPAPGAALCAEDPVLERLTALALLDAEEGFPRGEPFAEGVALAAAAHLAGCGAGGRLPAPPGARDRLNQGQLRAVRAAVEAALPGKPRLADLAEAAAHPTSRLGAAFRLTTGRTLWDYVAERRAALAEELLREPGLSLASVALRAGYSSQAHMATAFKRARGASPSAWRRARKAG